MKKKGIGFRIVLMAVVLSAIAAGIGCIGLYTTKRVSVLAADMYRKDVLRVQYAESIQIDILTARSILLDANTPGRTQQDIESYKSQFKDGFSAFNDDIAKYESTNIVKAERKALLQTVKDAGKEYAEKGTAVFDYIQKGDLTGADKYMNTVIVKIRTEKLGPAVDKLITGQVAEAASAYTSSMQISSLSVMIIIIAILAGLALSLTLGLAITRSITKPVTKMVNSLSDSSGQIGISSTQLSSASQEIANGAQEQAASIEETTSSMEELSSMVRQNLGNTRQASLLAQKATEAGQSGSDKMNDMLTAMSGISKSTEEIRNVIDVIDDIAFQTNMLALNAAVEAARAGEAGMGFAVVADEVKNLANRSAESAKETAAMIKETLRNVESGMSISKELSETFKDILANSKKVMEMNREVETASGQQDEGIGQVNKAMIQFDTVVQTNASSAEETASAAEELQGQVTSLNDIVDTLYLIVSGKEYSGRGGTETAASPHAAHTAAPASRRPAAAAAAHAPAKVSGHEGAGKAGASGTSVKGTEGKPDVKPEQKDGSGQRNGHAISFEDDEDFRPV
jgi:methyl-accepting chemotaxis protein